jgi:hypothetical protein
MSLLQFFLYFCDKFKVMATTKEKSGKPKTSEQKEKTPKKVSKTWLAMLKNAGNGRIIDMKAVLK